MDNINDPRHPDFDLRTATPDPRWLASGILERTDNSDADFGIIRTVARDLQLKLAGRYPDETMDMFMLVVEFDEGRRVVVGFGFSHNPLEGEV